MPLIIFFGNLIGNLITEIMGPIYLTVIIKVGCSSISKISLNPQILLFFKALLCI